MSHFERAAGLQSPRGQVSDHDVGYLTEEGLVVQIFGGERPHVGAIALSMPRPGLADPVKVSYSTTVVPLPGHKDDEVAKPTAEAKAKAWGSPVVVVGGCSC